MQKYLDLTKEQFLEFIKIPVDTPLQMLNLLKFKSHVEETGVTGAEQYKNYMKETVPFFQKSNAKVLFYGSPKYTVIGPQGELEWDKVLIVEYAKKEDFINMITAEGYPSEVRKLALEDSRLIFCEPITS